MAGWRELPVVVVCVGMSGTKLLIQGFGLAILLGVGGGRMSTVSTGCPIFNGTTRCGSPPSCGR